MNLKSIFMALAALLSVASFIRAEDAPNAGETRLREAVRSVTLQLRSAQGDLSAAQADQAQLQAEKKALTDQLAILQKRDAAERSATEKAVATAKAKIATLEALAAQQREALEKTRLDLQKATEAAQISEKKASNTNAANVLLQRRAEDRERKNIALYVLANEILGKYEDFSLGKALAAKEPFVGKTRVRLENLMQDYQDKIDEQSTTP